MRTSTTAASAKSPNGKATRARKPATKSATSKTASATTGARIGGRKPKAATPIAQPSAVELILKWLDDAKAEDIVPIDVRGKSSLADHMIVASGRSDRHVGAIADHIAKELKKSGLPIYSVEGQPQCDWVVVDAGDVIVHVFRPDVRDFYNLEKMWLADRPVDNATH